MLTTEQIASCLEKLGVDQENNVIVHSSLKSFGAVQDGPAAVVKAIRKTCGTVLMPTFTWVSLYYPDGWELNGNCPMHFDSHEDWLEAIQSAIPYTPDLPTSSTIGIIPETFRLEPDVLVSGHPIHRYAAVGPNAEKLLHSQTPDTPLEPIAELRKLSGWILLLGVGHNRNTAIHLAEHEMNLPQWTYWALTQDQGIVQCNNHPGCSGAFDRVESILQPITREVMIGNCRARLLPVAETIDLVKAYLKKNPFGLYCEECRRCELAAKKLNVMMRP